MLSEIHEALIKADSSAHTRADDEIKLIYMLVKKIEELEDRLSRLEKEKNK